MPLLLSVDTDVMPAGALRYAYFAFATPCHYAAMRAFRRYADIRCEG